MAAATGIHTRTSRHDFSRKRWERQREEVRRQARQRRELFEQQREAAIRAEQIERCYKYYTPPQIAAAS